MQNSWFVRSLNLANCFHLHTFELQSLGHAATIVNNVVQAPDAVLASSRTLRNTSARYVLLKPLRFFCKKVFCSVKKNVDLTSAPTSWNDWLAENIWLRIKERPANLTAYF